MANMTFKANLLPNTDLGYNLGSSDLKWNIYGNLQHITLDSTTINNSAGTFFFSGSGEPYTGCDWVGLQVGDNNEKFQIMCDQSSQGGAGNHLSFRFNDNGGTNTSWSNWQTYVNRAGDTISGDLTFSIAQSSNLHIKAQTSSNTWNAISFLNANNDGYGVGVKIGAGGSVIMGAGESSDNFISATSLNTGGTESLYALADGEIFIESTCDAIANRKGIKISNGNIIPVVADANSDNTLTLGTAAIRWKKIYGYGFGKDDTCSILPSEGNEINFGGTGTSGTIFFGYRATDGRTIPTAYVFGTGNGTAQLKCSNLFINTGLLEIDHTGVTRAAKTMYTAGVLRFKNSANSVNYGANWLRYVGTDGTDGYNTCICLGSVNGTTWITAGESGATMPTVLSKYNDENLYLSADGAVNIYSGCANDASSYKLTLEARTNGYVYTTRTYGAVWNDYAEMRCVPEDIEPGRCVKETGNGDLILTVKRLERGCNIISDTYGFAIGETEICKTPIAVSGRVLVYCYEGQEEAKKWIGYGVCSGPNGTVSIMTEEEERLYPNMIIGTISEVPNYDIWHAGNKDNSTEIKVNGRIWVKVK